MTTIGLSYSLVKRSTKCAPALTINRHGGDATLIHLPDIGIKGNSHFLMAEKNNVQLAELMSGWLRSKGLEK